jgi:uncharacterized coiled-coil DUF342 family protein
LSKQQKIEELTERLLTLRDQKDKVSVEADKQAEKRDKLNEQFKELRSEISLLKNERDKFNENVKWLKQRRTELKEKIHEKIKELNKLKQEAKNLAEERPLRNHKALQEEFESLEWRIQTTSLSLKEEKELVEQVKQIEMQLNVYRKLTQKNQRILELRTELKTLDSEGKQCHEELTKIAQESQGIHEKMLTKIEESKKTKAEADALHQIFVQTKENLKPIRDEISEILVQISQLKAEMRVEEEKEKKRNEETLRDALEKQAREKLRRGEKLSWEEFQILAEEGMGAQD